jgi:hypothetical protein
MKIAFCLFFVAIGSFALATNMRSPSQPLQPSTAFSDPVNEVQNNSEQPNPNNSQAVEADTSEATSDSPVIKRSPAFEAPTPRYYKEPTPKTQTLVQVENDTYSVPLPKDPNGFKPDGVFFYDPITKIDHQGHTREGFTANCKYWYDPKLDRRVPNPGLDCKVVYRSSY